MFRLKHPTRQYDCIERTYREIVKVHKGMAVCKTESAAKALRQRGYNIVDDEPEQKPKKKAAKKKAVTEKKS